MSGSNVPQPDASRLTDFAAHPLVVGFVPDQPAHVALTAATLSRATGGGAIYFAYVDTARYTVEEFADGTVRHASIDPDTVDDSWKDRERDMADELRTTMGKAGVPWVFRYLAGRPDRALTHLARAVDAATIVVGTREPGVGARAREFLDGSVAVRLAHHQHRPVLVVPLSVVDWKEQAWGE